MRRTEATAGTAGMKCRPESRGLMMTHASPSPAVCCGTDTIYSERLWCNAINALMIMIIKVNLYSILS